MSTPTKVLLLGATLDSDNRGIGALAMGALAVLVHRFPGCDVRFVDYAHDSNTAKVLVNEQSVSIPLINLRFSKKMWLANNIAWLLLLAVLSRLLGQRVRTWLTGANPWLRQIDDADIAVAISGGDSFSDIYGLARFLYMALPQLLVIVLGRPLILLPQTIGPMRSWLAKRVARFIISRARLTFSREVDGIAELETALGLPQGKLAVRFGYDLGFLLEPRRPERHLMSALHQFSQADRPLVGVNVSGLLRMGGYSGDNMFELKCNYNDLVQRVLELLMGTKGANVLLVPHVFGRTAESDLWATEEVFAQMNARYPGQLARLTETLSESEVKFVIGQCDLFVGSRMHACIAALSQSVPAVGIAYSKKFLGVLASVGAARWVADPRHNDIVHVLQIVDDAFTEREDTRSRLEETMPGVKAHGLNMLATIA